MTFHEILIGSSWDLYSGIVQIPANSRVGLVILYMDVSKNRETPQNGWFIMENLIKMDALGVPLFLETPIYSKRNPGRGPVVTITQLCLPKGTSPFSTSFSKICLLDAGRSKQHIVPNGNLMLIYHGTVKKKTHQQSTPFPSW